MPTASPATATLTTMGNMTYLRLWLGVPKELIYLVIAFSISWQAGLASFVAGGILMAVFQGLIRGSRKAGQEQTVLMKSLLTSINGQLARA